MFIDGFDADVALIPMDKEEAHEEPEFVVDPKDCPEMYFTQSDIDAEIMDVMSIAYNGQVAQ
jgi:hypothetical protein